MAKQFKGKKVVRGSVTAEAIVCPESFSFLGDVDMSTGEILSETTGNYGENMKHKILIYKEAKGSSGGCVVLLTMANQGIAPAALVTVKPADFNMTEGAILAKIPFICSADAAILSQIKTGDIITVDADNQVIIK